MRLFNKRQSASGISAKYGDTHDFVPAYTPMHGPGAAPEKKPDGWKPNRLQKTGIALVCLLVVAGLVAGIASLGEGKQPKSSQVSSRNQHSGDDDLRTEADDRGVLGAQTTSDDGVTPKPNPAKSPSATPPTNTTVSKPATPPPGTSPAPPSATPPANPQTPQPPASPQPQTWSAAFGEKGFSPAAITIRKGDTITIVNTTASPILPVCSDGSCGATAPLLQNQTWSYTFNTAGTVTITNTLPGLGTPATTPIVVTIQ